MKTIVIDGPGEQAIPIGLEYDIEILQEEAMVLPWTEPSLIMLNERLMAQLTFSARLSDYFHLWEIEKPNIPLNLSQHTKIKFGCHVGNCDDSSRRY